MNRLNSSSQYGFTLIELIVVIILLAILSVYASSRYFGASSVDSHLIQSELLSSIRLTQLRAMHRSGLCNRWGIVQNQAAQIIEHADTTCTSSLDESDSSFVDAASHNVTLTFSTNSGEQFIDFDNLGRPNQCATESGQCELVIQTQSGPLLSICINTQGGINGC
ncbi:Tfp pilus assembly protein FimT/FimU [Vibrio splendidus]